MHGASKIIDTFETYQAAGDAVGVTAEKVYAAAESGSTARVLPAVAEMEAGRMAGVGEVFARGEVVGSEGGETAALVKLVSSNMTCRETKTRP
jgi:hypothetical protein